MLERPQGNHLFNSVVRGCSNCKMIDSIPNNVNILNQYEDLLIDKIFLN